MRDFVIQFDSPGVTESVAEWRQIRASGSGLGAAQVLRRHTALIERMLAFMVDIADHSELTLEGDIAPYYMMDTVVLENADHA